MKALLAAIMCLLLTTAESFALKGGPVYPGGTNLVGTYAGVLIPEFDPTDPFSTNSIGVFATGVPTTGLTSGVFAFFTQGRLFLGTMEGVADPKGGTIKGILQADIGEAPGTATDALPSARGKLDAKVVPGSAFGAAARVRGTAILFVSEGNTDAEGKLIVSSTFTLTVDGFKQSDTATTPTLPTS